MITGGFKADGLGHRDPTRTGRWTDSLGGLVCYLLGPVVEVHGTEHSLVIALLCPQAGAVLYPAAGVSQVLGCVPEAMVVSVVQGFPQVGGHDTPGGSMGDTAAGAPTLVQGAAHVGRAAPGLLSLHPLIG